MALKSTTTIRTLPDSPGWYWYRESAADTWTPINVYSEPNGTALLVNGEDIEDLSGEWGDEILPPKKAHPALIQGAAPAHAQPRQRKQRVDYKPDPNAVIIEEQFSKFIYWIKERHQIQLKREKGEKKPWTQDPILQTNFFCSPFRELDKTTRWFKTHLREPLMDDPRVVFATIAFRWFNYIPTGELLLDNSGPPATIPKKKKWTDPNHSHGLFTNWDSEAATKLLHNQKQIFTGAHVVASGTGISKLDSISHTLGRMWDAREEIYKDLAVRTTSLETAHKYLMTWDKIGSFFAYEIVSDLRHTHLLRHADDVNTWANPGPGAMRGLNRLYGRPISFSRETHDWQREFNTLYALTTEVLHRDGFLGRTESSLTRTGKPDTGLRTTKNNTSYHVDPLYNTPLVEHSSPSPELGNRVQDTKSILAFEMREIESSLCEFDKYMRLYQPPTDEEYRAGDNPKQSKRKFKGI